MDAARAAKRLKGVKKVSIIYRRTAMFMPAEEEELRLAMEDGVIFRELLQPISHKEGKLLCSVMTLGERDASGRRSPIPTEKTVMIPADTLIEAVGENVDSDLFTDNNIFVDHKGRAVTCRKSYETNIKGVYVAGDARCGPKTVVEAIADARRVADHIAFREGLCKSNDLEKNMRDTDRLRLKRVILYFVSLLKKNLNDALNVGSYAKTV